LVRVGATLAQIESWMLSGGDGSNNCKSISAFNSQIPGLGAGLALLETSGPTALR